MFKFVGNKIRLYPTKEQAQKIDKTIGCCRYVYNYMLKRQEKIYFRRKEHLSYIDMQNLLPDMKKYLPWLTEADSQALKYTCRQLANAYKNFFKGLCDKPKLKRKHNSLQSYTTTHNDVIKILDKKIKLPILGIVKCKGLRYINGKIYKATIRKTSSGKYFVSILYKVEIEDVQQIPISNIIGIDVGIKDFAVDSNGNHYSNPKFLLKSLKKLQREQRKLSKKVFKSKNWDKQRIRVAKIYEHISNQRYDHHHKLSRKLTDENQVIGVEDLDIKNMLNNHDIARNIIDASWNSFLRMLEYKMLWKNQRIIKVSPFFPSSQLCSYCGYKNQLLKNLNIRQWTCPICGTNHQRDENAAKNILQETLQKVI